ncbi:cytochrome c oxidase assembly protein [Aquipuribacter hungaricus]|uniref:Cytochrome c oxidase assembly protein n=1 Tax=Aquipuribacter hungaricus TaxID=545624 RepID=A0ABV7WMA9_9MICO
MLPAVTLAALTVAAALCAVLSRDARAVLSLTVPHLGGVDGAVWPVVVLRVAVLALLASTLITVAGESVRPARGVGLDGAAAAEGRLTRLVLISRVSAVALFLLAVVETFGAAAVSSAGSPGAPSGGDAVFTSHVLAMAGSTGVLLSLLRPARTVLAVSGWALLGLAVSHLPLVLLGSWVSQPEVSASPVAVVARAAWLSAVVLTAGPVLTGLLTADRSTAPGLARPSRHTGVPVVPVVGVLAAGYAALLTVSTAEVAAATSMFVVVGVCGAAVAVVAAQRDTQRARSLALVALGVLVSVPWLVLPSPSTTGASPTTGSPMEAVGGEQGHAGMAMGMGSQVLAPLEAVDWFTRWTFDPLFAPVALLSTGGYLVAVVRLRRRGHRWPARRTFAWCLGWTLFGWATNGAPAVYGMALFSMHMVQHMTISMAVPAFLVLAAPVSLAFRTLAPRSSGRGLREWLLVLVHSGMFRLVASPLVAPPLFVISLMVFYYSPLFELAMASYVGHVLMTLHFLLSGYLFAWVLVGIDPGPQRPPYPLRLMILIITMAFHAFFGIILMSSDVILAEDWFLAAAPSWVDLAQDQYVGGAIAWGLGDYPVAILSVALAFAWLRDDDREQRRYDRQADRDGDAALAAYNLYLRSLDGASERSSGQTSDPPHQPSPPGQP